MSSPNDERRSPSRVLAALLFGAGLALWGVAALDWLCYGSFLLFAAGAE